MRLDVAAARSPRLLSLRHRCAPPLALIDDGSNSALASAVGGSSSVLASSSSALASGGGLLLAYKEDELSPVSDLFGSGPAVAYLVVLTLLLGGLGFLALQDRRAAAKRMEGLEEMRRVAAQLEADGSADEAAALTQEAARLEKLGGMDKPPPKKKKARRKKTALESLDDDRNRYTRRDMKAREKANKSTKVRGAKRPQFKN